MGRRYRDDDRYGYRFKPYVPVAQKKERAAAEAKKLAKKGGVLAPVQSSSRKIAETWWGQAWCRNLERYSDFASRLPRGRSYLSHGAVIDLRIGAGQVTAQVMGSELYKVRIEVTPLVQARWNAVVAASAGEFASLVDLLAGRFSDHTMQRLTDSKQGLFPEPKEIKLGCSCPDWASMCKHVAAALYGVGVRLDEDPALLFRLRQVNEEDLVAVATNAGSFMGASSAQTLEGADLSAIFGIELDSATAAGEPRATTPAKKSLAPTPRASKPAKKETPPRAAKLPAKLASKPLPKSLPKSPAKSPTKLPLKSAPKPQRSRGRPAPGEPSKLQMLRNFTKKLPKNWDALSSRERKTAAQRATGMTAAYLAVVISQDPMLKDVFGVTRRSQRSTRGR
jgi:uncharacterized Zn finger protein